MDVVMISWIVGALIAVGLVAWSFTLLKKWQIIKQTPTSNISDLYQGAGEVEGRVVELGETLESPISRKPCVAFHFKVEQKVVRRDSDGDRRTSWRTIVDDKRGVLFGVDDGTGIAAVDPNLANLVLDREARARSGFFSEAPSHLESTLNNQYGVSTKNWVFNKDLRFTESILSLGEPLYVLGEVNRQSAEDPVVFSKGIVPFIVSDKSQGALLNRFLWQAVGCWIGGVLALVLAGFVAQSVG